MNAAPVILINAFEVPEGEDEVFLAGWERAHAFLSTQEGYIWTRLHRSLSPGADFRFVNIALWQSQQAFQAATSRREFRNAPVPLVDCHQLFTGLFPSLIGPGAATA